ncbi:hypothetical protein BGW80DRAFT_1382299 [Lactifluus volemus]|nr:hypothetical protein BGW80DRAFT_1382299 [Lactifluus volemus]
MSVIPDSAQVDTQEHGRRPYGVGVLVIGLDHTGPHIYKFSPSAWPSDSNLPCRRNRRP